MVVKITLLQKVIFNYTTVKEVYSEVDNFWLSEFHIGTGTKK